MTNNKKCNTLKLLINTNGSIENEHFNESNRLKLGHDQKLQELQRKGRKLGKVFILKNNQPDAILFSIKEYERLSILLEYFESLDDQDISKVIEALPHYGKREFYTMNQMKKDVD